MGERGSMEASQSELLCQGRKLILKRPELLDVTEIDGGLSKSRL